MRFKKKHQSVDDILSSHADTITKLELRDTELYNKKIELVDDKKEIERTLSLVEREADRGRKATKYLSKLFDAMDE